jgi:hypothetical protein
VLVRVIGAIRQTTRANLGTDHVREPWYVVWTRWGYGFLLALGEPHRLLRGVQRVEDRPR